MASRIALDSSILIYFLENIEPYGERVGELLTSFMRREKTGVVSAVSIAEIMTGFYASGDERRAMDAKRFLEDLTLDGFGVVPLTFEIADLAAQLRGGGAAGSQTP